MLLHVYGAWKGSKLNYPKDAFSIVYGSTDKKNPPHFYLLVPIHQDKKEMSLFALEMSFFGGGEILGNNLVDEEIVHKNVRLQMGWSTIESNLVLSSTQISVSELLKERQ